MNLEADQAVQEARFAGACQDQHAGRPAPNLGWPGDQSCNKPKQVLTNRYGALGPGFAGAWGPGLGAGASRALGRASSSEKVSGEGVGDCRGGHGIPPHPRPLPL